MDKYTVIVRHGGSYGTQPCSNLNEIKSFISYLLSEKKAGQSVSIEITKNKD